MLLLGFAIGIYGHVTRSRWVILLAIVIIGAVSLYFVAVGEVASLNK